MSVRRVLLLAPEADSHALRFWFEHQRTEELRNAAALLDDTDETDMDDAYEALRR